MKIKSYIGTAIVVLLVLSIKAEADLVKLQLDGTLTISHVAGCTTPLPLTTVVQYDSDASTKVPVSSGYDFELASADSSPLITFSAPCGFTSQWSSPSAGFIRTQSFATFDRLDIFTRVVDSTDHIFSTDTRFGVSFNFSAGFFNSIGGLDVLPSADLLLSEISNGASLLHSIQRGSNAPNLIVVGNSRSGILITDPSPVPEPGTFALFGIGLLGMCAARRRKKA